MKIDLERGLANRVFRAFAAFVPMRSTPRLRFTPEIAASRYARGNVYLQSGRIVTEEAYERQRQKVLAYEFG